MIIKYLPLVGLMELWLFSSVGSAFGAAGTGFDPVSGRYNGGSGGTLSLMNLDTSSCHLPIRIRKSKKNRQ